MRSPSARYTSWWRASGRRPSKAAPTSSAAKWVLSSDCTSTCASGIDWRISSAICCGFICGWDLKSYAGAEGAICAQLRRYHGAGEPQDHRRRMNAAERNAASEVQALESARRTFDIEAGALAALSSRLDGSFVAA